MYFEAMALILRLGEYYISDFSRGLSRELAACLPLLPLQIETLVMSWLMPACKAEGAFLVLEVKQCFSGEGVF